VKSSRLVKRLQQKDEAGEGETWHIDITGMSSCSTAYLTKQRNVEPKIKLTSSDPAMPKVQRFKAASKAATVKFVEPMYAPLVQNQPDGNDWVYEVKFDGYSCLAKNRLPVMYENSSYVDDGGLMAYGPSQSETLERALSPCR
jgi:hypothetical protein